MSSGTGFSPSIMPEAGAQGAPWRRAVVVVAGVMVISVYYPMVHCGEMLSRMLSLNFAAVWT
jgi:hypothetical protein